MHKIAIHEYPEYYMQWCGKPRMALGATAQASGCQYEGQWTYKEGNAKY